MGADIVAIWMGRIILAVIVTVVLVWMLRRVGSTLKQVVGYIEIYLQKRGRGLNFRSVEVLSADAIHRFILSLVGTARIVATFSLLYAWLLVVAWSLDASKRVFGVVEQPLLGALTTVGTAIINFIPNLMMLTVIVVIARLSTRVIAILTEAVGEQRLHFDWLPTELAVPTRRLATILVWGTALVMAAPYLPGSDSKAFLGICIMLGILVSLGSTSVTANLLSGLVLTYARTYSKGDWVEIGDVVGDVVNLGPFTTRIRTIKDEEVIIPNAVVQAGSVRNFTRYAAGHGVQIHTEVMAGYDVPWRTMHRVLLEAANATDGVRATPAPYVLARGLDEHSVRYELYAYCDVPRELHLVEARMCQAILDACGKEGVDIRAPHLRRSHDESKSLPLAPPAPPKPVEPPAPIALVAPPAPETTPEVQPAGDLFPPLEILPPPPSKPPPLPSKPATPSIKPPVPSVKAATPSIKPPPLSVKPPPVSASPASVKPPPVSAPVSVKPPPVSAKRPSSIKPPPSDS